MSSTSMNHDELIDRAHIALDTKNTEVTNAVNKVDKTNPDEIVVFSEGDDWDIDVAACMIYAGYNVTYRGNSLWSVQGNKKDYDDSYVVYPQLVRPRDNY